MDWSHKQIYRVEMPCVGALQSGNSQVIDTRVNRSSVLPAILDRIAVPVALLVEQLRGAGATTVSMRTTFLNDQLRISRTPDNAVFVYTRV